MESLIHEFFKWRNLEAIYDIDKFLMRKSPQNEESFRMGKVFLMQASEAVKSLKMELLWCGTFRLITREKRAVLASLLFFYCCRLVLIFVRKKHQKSFYRGAHWGKKEGKEKNYKKSQWVVFLRCNLATLSFWQREEEVNCCMHNTRSSCWHISYTYQKIEKHPALLP